jgi:hypothetical protein
MTGKKKKEAPFVWSKGAKTETVQVGDGSLTFRGLSYNEILHVAPMDKVTSDTLTLRMGTVGADGIIVDGEPFTPGFEDYEYNSKTVHVLDTESFELLYFYNIGILGQALTVIKELSGLTEDDVEAVRFRRST